MRFPSASKATSTRWRFISRTTISAESTKRCAAHQRWRPDLLTTFGRLKSLQPCRCHRRPQREPCRLIHHVERGCVAIRRHRPAAELAVFGRLRDSFVFFHRLKFTRFTDSMKSQNQSSPLPKQGSSQWAFLRAGIPTASEFDNIVTPSFAPRDGKTVETYLYTKLAERCMGCPLEQYGGGAMQQGTILESEALPFFEFTYGVKLQK